jgi:hypothetical protein
MAIPAIAPKSISPQEKALDPVGEVYNTVSRASVVAKGSGFELR